MDTNDTRILFDALDHYLDQLVQDAREGYDNAADMARAEELLASIDPTTWTMRVAA